MIFALRQPAILLGLLLGFAIGVAIRVPIQRRIVAGGARVGARRFGRRKLRAAGAGRARLRGAVPWSQYLDPYGAVAALLSGAGWGARGERRFSRSLVDIWNLIAALVIHGGLAVAGFAGYVAAGGRWGDLQFIDVSKVLHGDGSAGSTALSVTLAFGMVNLACGLLALIPIPPLELGVILWSRLPKSPGARRVAYHVLEEQWGVAAVLLLLLLPLGGGVPPLLSLINSLGSLVLKPL